MADIFAALASTIGEVIVGIQRIFYVFQESVNAEVGGLELTFADGRVIMVDSGADGESLGVSTLRWEDPFLACVMSSENRDFIAGSGKWSAFDVSESDGYAMFVGSRIEKVAPISIPGGAITGVTFGTSAGELRAEVEADNLYVHLS